MFVSPSGLVDENGNPCPFAFWYIIYPKHFTTRIKKFESKDHCLKEIEECIKHNLNDFPVNFNDFIIVWGEIHFAEYEPRLITNRYDTRKSWKPAK